MKVQELLYQKKKTLRKQKKKNLEKAMELKPNHDVIYYHLATISDIENNPNKAIELLNKCIEINPKNFDA